MKLSFWLPFTYFTSQYFIYCEWVYIQWIDTRQNDSQEFMRVNSSPANSTVLREH